MSACVRTLRKTAVLQSHGLVRRLFISGLDWNSCFNGDKTNSRMVLNSRRFHLLNQSTNLCLIWGFNQSWLSRRFESSWDSYKKWEGSEWSFDEENDKFENPRSRKLNRSSQNYFEGEQDDNIYDEADEKFSPSSNRSNQKRRTGHFNKYRDDSEGDDFYDKRKDNSMYSRSKKTFSRKWSDSDNRGNRTDFGGIFQGREGRSHDRDYELYDKSIDHDFYNTKKTDFSNELPIEKNFYTEHPDVTSRPEDEIQAFLESNEVTIEGTGVKRPIFHFKEAGFPENINRFMEDMDFQKPSLIQSVGWPNVLSGSDVIGIAQTGSGKTLTFLLPAILHIHAQREKFKGKGNGPFVLVVCPTRELALQCQSVVNDLYKVCRIRSVAVYGGESKLKQERELYAPNVEMVVATPGRLIDFMNMGSINLERTTYLVLDEADRMLDMGFEPQIRAIMNQIRPDRQLLMWSATWPLEIQDLARDFIKDHVHIKIGSEEHTVNKDITHEFEPCMTERKTDMLLDHLQSHRSRENPDKPAKTLIFSSTKSNCDRLAFMLGRSGIRAAAIHGDKSQAKRDSAMRAFRTGYCNVLVASDVAARGLDVSDIEYVINFDLPQNIESYIHRSGRTGRAGNKGVTISYITANDLSMVPLLMKLLKEVGQENSECLINLDQERRKMNQIRTKPKKFRKQGMFRF